MASSPSAPSAVIDSYAYPRTSDDTVLSRLPDVEPYLSEVLDEAYVNYGTVLLYGGWLACRQAGKAMDTITETGHGSLVERPDREEDLDMFWGMISGRIATGSYPDLYEQVHNPRGAEAAIRLGVIARKVTPTSPKREARLRARHDNRLSKLRNP